MKKGEKFTYWNAEKRKCGCIERANFYNKWKWYALHDEQVNGHPTFVAAVQEMRSAGYDKMGFVDESGVLRHNMGETALLELYKKLDNFIADCTRDEVEAHRGAFTEILGLIHQRVNGLSN